MAIGVAYDYLKRRIYRIGRDEAAVETDRLQVFIHVAGVGINGAGVGPQSLNRFCARRADIMGCTGYAVKPLRVLK
jgi:hypothetical protein